MNRERREPQQKSKEQNPCTTLHITMPVMQREPGKDLVSIIETSEAVKELSTERETLRELKNSVEHRERKRQAADVLQQAELHLTLTVFPSSEP